MPIMSGLEFQDLRMRLDPSNCIIDINQRLGITVAPLPEIQRRNGYPAPRQPFVKYPSAGTVIIGPHAAMQFYHRREGTFAIGPINSRE